MNTFRRPNVLLIYTDQQRGERLQVTIPAGLSAMKKENDS